MLQQFQPDVRERGEIPLFFLNREFSCAVQRLPVPQAGRDREQTSVSTRIIRQAEAIPGYLQETPLYARVDALIREDEFVLIVLELIEPDFAFEAAPDKATGFVTAIEREIR